MDWKNPATAGYGDQDKAENDDAPEEEAEAGDHRAPVLRTLSFAHHPVDGEQHSGAQGQSYAHHVQLDMQGVDNARVPRISRLRLPDGAS